MQLSPMIQATAAKTGLGARLAPSTLLAWQLTQLRQQLAYAREHSVYYRRLLAGFDLGTLTDRAALAQLPLTTAEIFQAQPADLLCVAGHDVERITTLQSSSSSGRAKRIFFTDADLARTVDFFAVGMSGLVQPGQSTLMLLSDATPNSIADLLQRALQRLDVSVIIQGPQPYLEPVREKARGVDCIVGMPAQLNRLCLTTPELRPQSVLLTADYLPESVGARLQTIWNTEVFTHYGLTEVGFGLCVSCRAAQGMHARDAEFLFEIIDAETQQPLPEGRCGELVVSSLANQAMPLMRYRTGDLTSLIPGVCGCGGPLARLGKVLGRLANRQQPLDIHALDEAVFGLDGVLDFRAELQADGVLRLVLDAAAPLAEQEIHRTLAGQGILAPAIEIEYRELPLYGGALKRQVRREPSRHGKEEL